MSHCRHIKLFLPLLLLIGEASFSQGFPLPGDSNTKLLMLPYLEGNEEITHIRYNWRKTKRIEKGYYRGIVAYTSTANPKPIYGRIKKFRRVVKLNTPGK